MSITGTSISGGTGSQAASKTVAYLVVPPTSLPWSLRSPKDENKGGTRDRVMEAGAARPHLAAILHVSLSTGSGMSTGGAGGCRPPAGQG